MGVLIGRLQRLIFSLAVLLSASSAAAQGRVMLLHDPRVDDDVRVEVSDALAKFSDVGVERFVQAADAQRLDPLSDRAFSRALPTGLVDVAVVLLPARRGVNMVLRSGRDGAVVSQHALKLRRGKLRRNARKSIPRLVQAVMAKLPPPSARAETPEREPDTLALADEPSAPSTRRQAEVVQDDEVVPEPAFEQQLSEAEESAADSSQEVVDDVEHRLLRLHVDVGAGVSTRSVELPIEAGQGSVSVGPSAAFDVGLEAAYVPLSSVSWRVQLRYQTSVGARIDERHIAGVERPMGIRSARFEALFMPTFDLSEVAQLRLALGYGVRGLRTDVHDQELSTVHSLRTPDYTLSGPVAGVALRLAFGDFVALTLAPDAQLLVSVGSDLKQRGVSGGGFAFGGTASLVVRLGSLLSVYLAYRQAHAQILGEGDHANVSDTERYITVGLRGAP